MNAPVCLKMNKLTRNQLKLLLETYLNQAKFDSEDFEQESARIFATGEIRVYKKIVLN